MFWSQPTRIVRVHIEATVEWGFAEDPDSGEWIGVCPKLNLNAVGDTFADAQQCASEAIHLLFLSLFKEGRLESYLRERLGTVQITLPEPGSSPRFDTSYITRITRARDLVPANA